jgi:hypothetical protein
MSIAISQEFTDIITEGDLKMPVLLPYLIGIVTAPLAAKIIKPIFRGVVKTTMGVALEVKRVAAEAGEELQDIAAEVSVEKVAANKAAKAQGHQGLS